MRASTLSHEVIFWTILSKNFKNDHENGDYDHRHDQYDNNENDHNDKNVEDHNDDDGNDQDDNDGNDQNDNDGNDHDDGDDVCWTLGLVC